MTPPELSPEELELRDALRTLLPTGIEMPTERIHAHVSHLRRRHSLRVAAAVAAGLVVVAIIVVTWPPGGAARGRVHVEGVTAAPRRHGVASTTVHVASTSTTEVRHLPAPLIAPTVPVPSSAPATTPTSTASVVAPPTTVAPPMPTSEPTTPTTVAPAPTPAAVTVTLVLDDSGLHAPAIQVAGGPVTIRFFDERTDYSTGSWPKVRATPHGAGLASEVIGRAWRDPDSFGHFDAAITYDTLSGLVEFQAYGTVGSVTDVPIGSSVTTSFTAR